MTTDPLITRYLPVVNGHIVKHYRWIEEKGNCLVSVEDLQQIAAMSLVKLAGKWDEILASLGKERDGDNALFWGYLRNTIKSDVRTFYRDHGRKGADDSSIFTEATDEDGNEKEDETWAAIRTSVRAPEDSAFGKLVWNNLIDYFELMPTRDKVLFALRHFDELSIAQTADVLSANVSTTGSLLSTERARWRTFARNQVIDFPTPMTPRRARPWEAPESLHEYVQTRHRKDLPEYLWYVTEAFRRDVSYLTEILGTAAVFAPGVNAPVISPYMQTQIDRMYNDGAGPTEISRLTGLTISTVIGHIGRRRAAVL